MVEIKAQA